MIKRSVALLFFFLLYSNCGNDGKLPPFLVPKESRNRECLKREKYQAMTNYFSGFYGCSSVFEKNTIEYNTCLRDRSNLAILSFLFHEHNCKD